MKTGAKSRRRGILWAFLAVVVVLAAGAGGLYLASRQVPEFYAVAVAADPATLKSESDTMLRHTAALNNQVRKPGRWEATFRDDEINGWLAVDMVQNHPELVVPEIRDVRMQFGPAEILLGARLEGSVMSAVVSLRLGVSLSSPNVVALRFYKARVGNLPWRLDQVVESIASGAQELDLHVEQTQVEGDPLLLITLPHLVDEKDYVLALDRLELRNGEIYLAGETAPEATRDWEGAGGERRAARQERGEEVAQ